MRLSQKNFPKKNYLTKSSKLTSRTKPQLIKTTTSSIYSLNNTQSNINNNTYQSLLTNFSSSRNNFNYKPFQTEINSNDFKKNSVNKNIEIILNRIKQFEKSIESNAFYLENNIKDVITKESLIFSLKKDLNYHKNINKKFIEYKNYIEKLNKISKFNYEKLLNYQYNLNIETSEFRNIISTYDKKLFAIRDKKGLNKKTQEQILKEKIKKQEELKNNLNKVNNDLNELNSKLISTNEKVKNLNNENDKLFYNIENFDKISIEKYDNLLFKYNKLMGKYYYYINIKNENIQIQFDDDINQRKFNNENNEIDIRLKDKKIKEEFLNNVINNILNNINKIKEENKQNEIEKERIRFLGKTLLKKTKEKNELKNN
jgi:hypothetical protein